MSNVHHTRSRRSAVNPARQLENASQADTRLIGTSDNGTRKPATELAENERAYTPQPGQGRSLRRVENILVPRTPADCRKDESQEANLALSSLHNDRPAGSSEMPWTTASPSNPINEYVEQDTRESKLADETPVERGSSKNKKSAKKVEKSSSDSSADDESHPDTPERPKTKKRHSKKSSRRASSEPMTDLLENHIRDLVHERPDRRARKEQAGKTRASLTVGMSSKPVDHIAPNSYLARALKLDTSLIHSSSESDNSELSSSSSSGSSSSSSSSSRKGKKHKSRRYTNGPKTSKKRPKQPSKKHQKPLLKPDSPEKYNGAADLRAFMKFVTDGTACWNIEVLMCLRARSHVHMVPTCLLFEICAPPLGLLILRYYS
ncbi:hypothetical protein BDZ89DRAFT_1119623 [Hymenopellis radicata]|nr:hypothetical protein BDZ89DRAFT_1119623 [Hymenopellis radicata]